MSGTLREDTTVYPTMIALKDCLCEELAKCGNPSLCFCDLVPGISDGFIDVAECDEGGGSAWVRLIQTYQSLEFPQPEVGANEYSFMVAELEVGCVRPITSIDEDGTAPDAVSQHMDTRMLLADMAAMKRAIYCCFGTPTDPLRDFALGAYTSAAGIGGAGGGFWRVFVRVT